MKYGKVIETKDGGSIRIIQTHPGQNGKLSAYPPKGLYERDRASYWAWGKAKTGILLSQPYFIKNGDIITVDGRKYEIKNIGGGSYEQIFQPINE